MNHAHARYCSRPRLAAAQWSASTWATLFAAVHAYWALDGRLGLPADIWMNERPLLFWVNLAAIPLCAIAAIFALMLRRNFHGSFRYRFCLAAAGCIAAFCLVHALPPLLGLAIETVSNGALPALSERDAYALLLYEPYWLTGGLLFGWLTQEAAIAPRCSASKDDGHGTSAKPEGTDDGSAAQI